MLNYVKVNLPYDEDDYINGNGEGVWVLVDDKTKAEYDSESAQGTHIGILDNDSLYHPKFVHGMAVVIEMRGEKRPVVPWLFLDDFKKYVKENIND